MKVRVTMCIDKDIMVTIDNVAKRGLISRSAFISQVLRQYSDAYISHLSKNIVEDK